MVFDVLHKINAGMISSKLIGGKSIIPKRIKF